MKSGLWIKLKNLQWFGRHGWHAEESLTGNTFEVSIAVHFYPVAEVITSIDDTINYAAVYAVAKKTFQTPQQLLETCAMQMAENIYQSFPQITRIQISIDKMAAPIPSFSGTVGITYEKEFVPLEA